MPDDTNKVNLLINLSKQDEFTDSNINFASKAYYLSLKLNYDDGMINSLHLLGIYNLLEYDYDGAYYYFLEELKMHKRQKFNTDLTALAECNRMIGEALRAKKEYDLSLKYLSQAESLFKKVNDKYGLAKTYNRFASVYYEKYRNNDKTKVIEYIEKSNKIALKNNYDDIVANNYNILATFYIAHQEFAMALEIYRKILNYFKNDEKFSEKPNILRNIATRYLQMGLSDSALFYSRLSYDASIKSKINSCIYESALQLYNIFYNYYDNIDSATYYLSQKNKYKEKLNSENKERSLIQAQIILESKLKDKQISEQKDIIFYQILVLIVIVLFSVALIILIYNKSKTHKRINEAIKIQNEKLEELNISKDKFFSIIAHDLKNPIGALKNLSGMLESDYNNLSEDEKFEFVKLLSDSSKNILDLLENLLTWSRSQRNKIDYLPSIYDVNLIVKSVLLITKIQVEEKNIKIINEIPNHTFAFFDVNMIYTVVRNLVSNSIKFSYPTKNIYIKSEEYFSENKKYIKISIMDEGVGIAEDKLHELFVLTEKSSSIGTFGEKGTGLGLIIVKEFINKNNGIIWAESEVNVGTTIHFTLPINPI